MNWLKWSEKSATICFASTQKGVGNGEAKVAAEIGAELMGQNKTFDLLREGVQYEVKQLDVGTFNTGQKGRKALEPVKTKLLTLLSALERLSSKGVVNLKKMNADELSVGSLRRLTEVCRTLHETKTKTHTVDQVKKWTDPFTGGEMAMTPEQWVAVYAALGRPLPETLAGYALLADLGHEYIAAPESLAADLGSLVSIFDDTELVIVDELEGYAFADKKKVVFERITRGAPRFRLLD
jgi:hypothetical protein